MADQPAPNLEEARRIAEECHDFEAGPMIAGSPWRKNCPGCTILRLLSEREAREKEIARLLTVLSLYGDPEGRRA